MIPYRETQRDGKAMDHNWSGRNRTKEESQGHKGERLKQKVAREKMEHRNALKPRTGRRRTGGERGRGKICNI